MYTSDTEKSLKTGMIYLAVSLAIVAAAAVYGLFSHGVYSYWMTYAFMIPMLLGAVSHLANALRTEASKKEAVMQAASGEPKEPSPLSKRQKEPSLLSTFSGDVQIAVIAALTAGSLLKGALDIYGTTNRLLIAYPVIAVLTVIGAVILAKRRESKTPDGPALKTAE